MMKDFSKLFVKIAEVDDRELEEMFLEYQDYHLNTKVEMFNFLGKKLSLALPTNDEVETWLAENENVDRESIEQYRSFIDNRVKNKEDEKI